ncbi:deoxyribonuclease/rho motif-related TRAM [Segniliparus rotundus DSM 44985]|uniref:Deoxyribonuclease/rho motif-related TRAM n=1 Tax=Segniliparus rotundus (strain ATCC BAA-972 / CDC 1076 / CIP 108378 / DSM 44985 / JCM 13578) TaxID=640132 RepID=D6ZFJ9_SEGRD|nr:TRAM domain-containing protein [Segniliparus rotundus]ADG97723.1 deoxyribonuclease/rho motif-related TRAM [Segniliparus rotundus DSM 44985]
MEPSLIELRTYSLANGGSAVGRHEHRAVFVRGALPGEAVRARVVQDKGSYWHADLVEVLEASPHRRPSLCPITEQEDSGCCDLAFLDPHAALELKGRVVAEQLARLGKVAWEGCAEVLGEPTRWRTRVRLAVDQAGRAGFHRYHSKELVSDLACPQPVAGALDGLQKLRLPAGAEVFVVVDDEGARHVQLADRTRGRRNLEGPGIATQRVGERVWRVPVQAFWQPHRDAARRYTELVAQWVGEAPGAVAWDLYGGAGLFAAVLARAVGPTGRVFTVDSAGASSRAAAASLKDLRHVEVLSGPTGKLLAGLPSAQVAVVDPPRAGAGRAVIAALARTERVIHIGCEAAAFSRDVGLYVQQGYAVREIRVFDAFPLTHHVECLALLERVNAP